jgi:unsaturated chondroitin disaccharide hydrolase
MRKLLYAIAVAGITVFMPACNPSRSAQGSVTERISALDSDLSYCDNQLHRTLAELADSAGNIDYTLSPRNILAGEQHWNLRRVDKTEWCGGFFPGILWYDYEATADTAILREAQRFTEPLAFLAHTPAYDHDLGFLVITSFLNGYRLTGDEAYKQVLLACADTLATLYNPRAGTILS